MGFPRTPEAGGRGPQAAQAPLTWAVSTIRARNHWFG